MTGEAGIGGGAGGAGVAWPVGIAGAAGDSGCGNPKKRFGISLSTFTFCCLLLASRCRAMNIGATAFKGNSSIALSCGDVNASPGALIQERTIFQGKASLPCLKPC